MRGNSAPDPVPGANGAERPLRPLSYLPFFCGDWLSSTRGWPVTARGIYFELLITAWDQGSLPADPKALRVLIGATPSEWRFWSSHVEAKFPIGADGRRRNRRLEQHRVKSLHISELRREIGRRGGAASAGRRAAPNGATT